MTEPTSHRVIHSQSFEKKKKKPICRVMMATDDSAATVIVHFVTSSRGFHQSRGLSSSARHRANGGTRRAISVTSRRFINRFHRGCRNSKEVERWMGHEAKQVNGVANRGQHREWYSVSLLPALLRGGVVCTCACASRPAFPHLRLFLASAYSFRDATSGK